MNNKAQVGIGQFVMIFVGVIVAISLFLASAQIIGLSTTSIALGGVNSNNTLLAADIPAVASSVDLVGQDLLDTPVVVNASGGQTVAAGNYTISEIVSATTGVKTISFQLDDPQFSSANQTASGSLGLNITYTYGPDGYINSGAGRSLALLIVILSALAIAVFVMSESLRNGLKDMFK